MAYETAVIVARAIDPEAMTRLVALDNGTGYVAYYARRDVLHGRAQQQLVQTDAGEFGLVIDHAGEIVDQGTADAMLAVAGGFQIVREAYTPNHDRLRITYNGALVTFFAEPEPAVAFVRFCVQEGIACRADWLAVAKETQFWGYMNANRAGGDLSITPFTE